MEEAETIVNIMAKMKRNKPMPSGAMDPESFFARERNLFI
jgi:hypothetical protein